MSMPSHDFVPVRRLEDVVIEALDDEVLVYDLQRNKAHCLNGTSAQVWNAIDGDRSVASMAAELGDSFPDQDADAIVWHALVQLSERRLLVGDLPEGAPARGDLASSRRELFRKAAMVGAAVVAVPVIRSIVAPDAAQAATCLNPGAGCASSAQCCSGLCLPSFICA